MLESGCATTMSARPFAVEVARDNVGWPWWVGDEQGAQDGCCWRWPRRDRDAFKTRVCGGQGSELGAVAKVTSARSGPHGRARRRGVVAL